MKKFRTDGSWYEIPGRCAKMYRKYIIDNFEYSREYFLKMGDFTSEEIQRLLNGETIVKGEHENRYYISNINGI